MPESLTHDVTAIDDRSPYLATEAIIQTIARLSTDLNSEDEAWEAYIAWKGPDLREYIETIRRTRHSIFFHQIQDLYELGCKRTPAGTGDHFCREAGRHFAERLFSENIYPLLQVATAKPGATQRTVVEMIRTYLYRYAGDKYVLLEEFEPEQIWVTVRARWPEQMAQYLAQYGLQPDRCFHNTFQFISGAAERFVERIVDDYDPARFVVSVSGQEGRICLPINEAHRLDYESLLQTLAGYMQRVETRRAAVEVDERLESDLIIGSTEMRRTWDRIRRASRTAEIVLLRGESGTGKSFIARKIHELSDRRDRPFIQVGLTSDIGSDNLIQSDLFGHERGAFTGAQEQKQGLFSLADGGTIFLDEIGDASPELQAKLLRVIESSIFKRLGGVRDIRVDVRVIAATNRNLEKIVEEGSFRQDLYYRINVIPIELPPLRDRSADIPALTELLLRRALRGKKSAVRRLQEGIAARLAAYPWPGNIRELDNALKYALAMAEGECITIDDFPEPVRDCLAARATGEQLGPQSSQSPGYVRGEANMRAKSAGSDEIIDMVALCRVIADTDFESDAMAAAPHEIPAHVEYAKRKYLSALIAECHGNLTLIGRCWDRGSEKTLRKLIETYGLSDQLAAARAGKHSSTP